MAAALHTYNFHAPSPAVIGISIVLLVSHAVTVIDFVFGIVLVVQLVIAVVLHLYLIVYVHAVNHAHHASDSVTVPVLPFIYVVPFGTVSVNVGAETSTVIDGLVLAVHSLFPSVSCILFAGNVNVGVPLVAPHLNVNVYVLFVAIVPTVTFVKLPLSTLLITISPVVRDIFTHALLSGHVNVIVAVAFCFMYDVLQFHQLHVGHVLSRYILPLATEFAAKVFHNVSVTAVVLHAYNFHAPVFPLIFTSTAPLVAHAAIVIVVLSVILAHVGADVHHPYLMVYVHAVKFMSDSFIVPVLFSAYVVPFVTDTANVGAELSKYIFTAVALLFAAKVFHNVSVTASVTHAYNFHAPVYPLSTTSFDALATPDSATVIVVVLLFAVMFAHVFEDVLHSYLIVYVHAVNHAQFVSESVIVPVLLFIYVVPLTTVIANFGAVLSTFIATDVRAVASLFHALSNTIFFASTTVDVLVVLPAVNVYVNVLDAAVHHATPALNVHAAVVPNVTVGTVSGTHECASVHVNVIVAVAPLFITFGLQVHQLHTGFVVSTEKLFQSLHSHRFHNASFVLTFQ